MQHWRQATTMKLHGKFTFNADQKRVWTILMNTDAVAKAMPWVESYTPLDSTNTAWRASARISFFSPDDVYTGIIRLSHMEPLERYLITVQDADKDTVGGSVEIRLRANGSGKKTILNWFGEATLPERFADLEPKAIQAGLNMMSLIFFSRIAKQLTLDASTDNSPDPVKPD